MVSDKTVLNTIDMNFRQQILQLPVARTRKMLTFDRLCKIGENRYGCLLTITSFTSDLQTTCGGAVASWLVRSTPERAVWVPALAGDIVLCS